MRKYEDKLADALQLIEDIANDSSDYKYDKEFGRRLTQAHISVTGILVSINKIMEKEEKLKSVTNKF